MPNYISPYFILYLFYICSSSIISLYYIEIFLVQEHCLSNPWAKRGGPIGCNKFGGTVLEWWVDGAWAIEHCSFSPWIKWGGPIGCGKRVRGRHTSIGYARLLIFKCSGQISTRNLNFEMEIDSFIYNLDHS